VIRKNLKRPTSYNTYGTENLAKTKLLYKLNITPILIGYIKIFNHKLNIASISRKRKLFKCYLTSLKLLGGPTTPTSTSIYHPSLNLLQNLLQTQPSRTTPLHLTTTYEPSDMISNVPKLWANV